VYDGHRLGRLKDKTSRSNVGIHNATVKTGLKIVQDH